MRRTLVALSFIPAVAFAYELRRDSTGNVVRWGDVVTFVMDENLTTEINEEAAFVAIDAAQQAIGSASPGLTLNLKSGPTSGVGYNFEDAKKNQNDIVIPEEWPYEENAIAVTVVTVDTRKHEIIDADIAFNAANRKFKVLGDEEANQAGSPHDDIQNTITHELGHALGLAHNPAMPDVVMYPSARRGEIKKRFIHSDDAAGLAFLYPAGVLSLVSENAPSMGCSSTGGTPWSMLALLFLPFLKRVRMRRQTGIALGALSMALAVSSAFAAPLERSEMPATDAEVVATAQVVSTTTIRLPGSKLLFTEVAMRVRECLKGACERTYTVRVPGGRWLHYEQFVDGLTVPTEGDVVGVALPGLQSRVLKSARVYALSETRDFSAFAIGAHRAGLRFEKGDLPTAAAKMKR